jgi:exonuclease III
MKILAWNCGGLALAPTICVLRAIIRSHRPDLIFMFETKVPSSRFRFSLHGLGFVDMLEVPPVGSRGGIFLTLKDGVNLEPVKLDSHSISCLVFSERLSTPWLFSMSELGNSFGGTWLLMGDFNYVLSSSEKSGGHSFGSPSHLEFLDFVHSNALVDLGFVGNRYTWSNHRSGRDNIRERLDRGLANQDWIQIFPNSLINRFPASHSDHCPILLSFAGTYRDLPKPFCFEAF